MFSSGGRPAGRPDEPADARGQIELSSGMGRAGGRGQALKCAAPGQLESICATSPLRSLANLPPARPIQCGQIAAELNGHVAYNAPARPPASPPARLIIRHRSHQFTCASAPSHPGRGRKSQPGAGTGHHHYHRRRRRRQHQAVTAHSTRPSRDISFKLKQIVFLARARARRLANLIGQLSLERSRRSLIEVPCTVGHPSHS